jgi:NIMA-interacting peptidyl-prolyl cis-trans isomerase 1
MAQHHSSKGVSPVSASHTGDKIRVAHLLVKHCDSRRPASWREPKITRSKEEARELIKKYQAQINAFERGQSDPDPKSLSELATTESDDSSARKGGDLQVSTVYRCTKSRLTYVGVSLAMATCKRNSR